MRLKSGAVGMALMVLSALITSSANTKTAEARSSGARTAQPVANGTPVTPTASSFETGADVEAPASLADAPPHEVITPPPADLRLENPKLRRLKKAEVTPAMLALAGSVVRRHHAKPVGTQIEVDVGGTKVIARLERHFHPEGGSVKPWGYHPGVSLFVAR